VSPRFRKKLACKNRDGDMPAGIEDERVSPEAVMAICSDGISLSMRASRTLMARIMLSSSE
jgi:hypothetical protein